MISFLNAMLPPHRQIETIRAARTEYVGETERDRASRLDFACVSQDGTKFNLEVQKYFQEHFAQRMLYYASKMLIADVAQGAKWNFSLTPVVVIGIIDWALRPDVKMFEYVLADRNLGEGFPGEPLRLQLVQLPLFETYKFPPATPLEEWIHVTLNPDDVTYEPKFIERKVYDQFMDDTKWQNLSPDERERYHSQWMRWNDERLHLEHAEAQAEKKGIEKGIERGIEKGIEPIILHMAAQGKDAPEISELTGVALEVVRRVLAKAADR